MKKNSKQGCRGDTTIGDIHKTRERISEAFKGDISAISAPARKRQEQSGRTSVSYGKKEDKSSG